MSEPKSTTWKPWDDHKQATTLDIEGVAGPPCCGCEHWKPQRKFRQTPTGFVFDGVALCHAEQFGDFSCFTERKAPSRYPSRPMNKWTPTTDLMTLRRLGKSCEELGELVAVLGRSICQGLDGVDPASGENNLNRIAKESADVMAQIECNTRAFRLSREAISRRVEHKIGLMAEWEALFEAPNDVDDRAPSGPSSGVP